MREAFREERVVRIVMVFAFVVAAFSVAGAVEASSLYTQEDETQAEGYEVTGATFSGDGDSLPGVLITLAGADGKQSTVSGEDGAFSFTSVPPGTYSLVFKVKGKKKAKREITVSNTDVELGMISLE